MDAREAWVQTPGKRLSNLAILTILPYELGLGYEAKSIKTTKHVKINSTINFDIALEVKPKIP